MIDVDIAQTLGDFHLDVKFVVESPIVGLFGRSGSGKTSVVNAIAGIARPERGRVYVNETCLFDSARGVDLPTERRRIGYVFQDSLLFPHLSVESNLLYGNRLRQPTERFIGLTRVVQVLGLEKLLKRKPALLSGGERQRVAIGRALLAQPLILLMDEPLAALDVPRKTEILDYVERLRDEFHIPIIYVSHSIPEITRLADTVVLLSDGKCLGVGDVETVLTRLDLKPATGRYEGGSLLETRVRSHDLADQLTTLEFNRGVLVVPLLDAVIGDRVRARVRARDVSLATVRPQGISILNVIEATVVAVTEEMGPIVDVQVAAGDSVLLSRITRRSLGALDIRVGQPIFALVKAVSFDQRSVGYA